MNDQVNMRMCVMCRQMFPKKKMVRVAVKEGQVRLDPTGKAGGRGAYLCSAQCLTVAKKERRLERALRTAIPAEIFEALEEGLKI